MSKQSFEKFINKSKGAKKKEEIRQDKRKFKQEQKVKGEEMNRLNEDKYRAVTSDTRRKPASTADSQAPKGKGPKASSRTAPAKESSRKEWKSEKPVKKDKKPFAAGEAQPDADRTTKGAPAKKSRPAEEKAGKPVAKKSEEDDNGNEIMPLNKFIAHSGVCARREAAGLVKEGVVVVNGNKILEPGFKVSASDKITVKGKLLFLQKNLVYVLLNKPKDFLTTAKDPQGRKTVLDLVKGATQERIYSVGRLDRNTTGVLLLTNDGELAQKLTHPSYEIKKIYEVRLDKPVLKKDLESIASGITLEDGFIHADSVGYVDPKDKSVVGIEIHSGRNRIVRRIFEHLGYDVKNLDRVLFANLTKKNVERGKWRLLTEKEIRLLKYMNQSFVKKKEKKEAQ
ncbi:23S rRNA pseudouridine2605 synthase [Filimonas lacunae]|uniref:Pseudouridine synthase n=1 Tax=Filimonas lacunae TaxID=477680 RepID=A0A1N7KUG7_9BACT|nr:pseudouridine synthase [Filimonas lacunae]SIS65235.1 23S rRNA pseudouridine2605 synthase [Filimonas lacunae]